MALESLQWEDPKEFEHQPEHDLESLFYVLISICTYVEVPGLLRGPIPLEHERSICANEWWSTNDRHVLARLKASQVSNLDREILNRFSPYWNNFHPVIQGLQKAIWKKECIVSNQKNVATHNAFLDILQKARDAYRDQGEVACPFAPIPATNQDNDVNSVSQKRKNKSLDIDSSLKRVKMVPESTDSISRSRPGPSQPRSSQTGAFLPNGYPSTSFQFINYTA